MPRPHLSRVFTHLYRQLKRRRWTPGPCRREAVRRVLPASLALGRTLTPISPALEQGLATEKRCTNRSHAAPTLPTRTPDFAGTCTLMPLSAGRVVKHNEELHTGQDSQSCEGSCEG